MKTKTAFQNLAVISMTVLSLAACGSNNNKNTNPADSNTTTTTGGTTGDQNSTSGTTGGITQTPPDPNGASVLSVQSPVNATVSGKAIPLPYVIFAKQANAVDSNRIYGIEFSDYDPCTQGSLYGWSTWPGNKPYNQLGFYFPSAPAAQTYTVGAAAGDIQASLGALGVNFTSGGTATCTPTNWLPLASGSVTLTSASDTSVAGTITLTLGDGSTVTGQFQSGTCSATGSGAVQNPNAAGQCTAEK